MSKQTRWGLAAAAATVAASAAWWWTDQAPYPYAQRRLLDLPLPYLTSTRLDKMLAPQPGQRVLEVGSGTGLQALHVAPRLEPTGRLDVVDIQQDMLDHVTRRAAERDIRNIVPTLTDARDLPFPTGAFDSIYMVTALGEIPHPLEALQEATRVLAPHGRLIVGEFFDRHWIPFGRLHAYADTCDLCLDARCGPTMAYLARFRHRGT